jgi:hypothetical protein
VLRILRLLRLSKVFRAIPQLLTLVKGITTALPSMFFTGVLLSVLIFVFGVLFRSQTKDSTCKMDVETRFRGSIDRCQQIEDLFGSVTESGWTLLLYGTFLDSPSMVTSLFWDNELSHLAWAFVIFIFLASFTVLNMFIGIVCEVVSKVSKEERELQEARYLKNNLLSILQCYDKDEDECVGPEEFDTFFRNPEVHEHLSRFGTKVQGVMSLKSVVFEETSRLKFSQLLELIMRLRGENKAEVTDIMELREFIRQSHLETREYLRAAIQGRTLGSESNPSLSPKAPSSLFRNTSGASVSRAPGPAPQVLAGHVVSPPSAPDVADIVLSPSSDAPGMGSNDSVQREAERRHQAVMERLSRIEKFCNDRKETEDRFHRRLGELEKAVVVLGARLAQSSTS